MKQLGQVCGAIMLAAGVVLTGCGGGGESKTQKTDEKGPSQMDKPGETPANAALPGNAARELVFPSDQTLGGIKVRPSGSDNFDDWTTLAGASGTVKIPGGVEVMLDLKGTAVGDLSHLASLEPDALQEVMLEGCGIGDDKLASLEVLRLKGLNLNGNPITDQGLKFLAGFSSLEKLSLGETQITDAGLAHLAGLMSLKKLWLQKTNITDAGLKHIEGLPSIEFLVLFDTGVTDAGLDTLKSLPRLERLGLRGTKISDAGLEKLAAFPALKEVMVSEGGNITKEGALHAQSMRGGLAITFATPTP